MTFRARDLFGQLGVFRSLAEDRRGHPLDVERAFADQCFMPQALVTRTDAYLDERATVSAFSDIEPDLIDSSRSSAAQFMMSMKAVPWRSG